MSSDDRRLGTGHGGEACGSSASTLSWSSLPDGSKGFDFVTRSASDLVVPNVPMVAVTRGSAHENLTGGQGLQIRFRPVRYKISDIGAIQWEILLLDADGKIHSCSPIDISANGIGILLPDALVVRINETLPSVEIRYEGHVAYTGRATIVSVREHDGALVAGLHLLDGLLEVSKLLDLKDVKSSSILFRDDLARRQSTWYVQGQSEFKGLVSDFRLFLEDAYYSLNDIEHKLPWHVVMGETDDALRTAIKNSFLEGAVRTFCGFFSSIDRAVRAADPVEIDVLKQVSRRHLHHFILQGPLFSRSLAKPRGYAGDYVTMNYIYGRHFEGSSLFARFVHMAGCQHDVCQAVRNRKDFLRETIMNRLNHRTSGTPCRIASIGSGPAREFKETLETIEPESPPFDIVLFDADDEALNYCYNDLTDTIHRRNLHNVVKLTLLYDSIGHLIFDDSVFRGTGPFDLIMCAGLYDYLSLKKAQALTVKLFSQLKPTGSLVIGNMAPANPSRWAMEHLAEWYLVYRDDDELLALGANLPTSATSSISQEPSGINKFLIVQNEQ